MKKYERVNQYLEGLLKQDAESVRGLSWTDLVGKPELAGIGDRTLRNILKEFQIKHDLLPEKTFSEPKSEIVRKYLLSLYERLSAYEFNAITASSLLKAPELAGIGRTMIFLGYADFIKTIPPIEERQPQSEITQQVSNTLSATIKKNLKKIQRTLNMGQVDIARMIGVERQVLQSISAGKTLPDTSFLYCLHKKLRINIHSFLFDEGDLFTRAEMSSDQIHESLKEYIGSACRREGAGSGEGLD